MAPGIVAMTSQGPVLKICSYKGELPCSGDGRLVGGPAGVGDVVVVGRIGRHCVVPGVRGDGGNSQGDRSRGTSAVRFHLNVSKCCLGFSLSTFEYISL